jgi:hypothetical protein
MTLGTDSNRRELRNRKLWKCIHCDEVQFAEANPKNKESHLKIHGITKHGRKTPYRPIDRHTKPAVDDVTPLRQSESYVQLTTAIMRNPFQEALIAFIVICQMAFNLVTNDVFFEFLHTIYPSIGEILPSSGNTIRGWIIDAFQARKVKIKQALEKSSSLIHFSFDLWTSPNHMALLGVIAHFIDEFGQNQSVSSVSFIFSTLKQYGPPILYSFPPRNQLGV